MKTSPSLAAGRIVYHIMCGDTLAERAWIIFEKVKTMATLGNPYAMLVRKGIANIARKLQAGYGR